MKEIHLWGVKQNNLKNIEVKIPVGSFTVVCGPSGSGKSSLAFETLFAEGQRRFIESMSNYARQFLNKAPKPDIEGVNNIPPAIAIEQKNSVKSSRSTVGTTTEITDYLRLLYEKIGKSYCPEHRIPTEKQSVGEATDKVLSLLKGKRGYVLSLISEKSRVAEGKKLHSLLLQEGYLRIFVPKTTTRTQGKDKKLEGEILELNTSALIKKGLPKKDFYLVVDRMAFQEEDRGRIHDSLTLGYEASLRYNLGQIVRQAIVLSTDGDRINLSEETSCSICSYTPPPLSSKLFSFNSPMGACPSCKGFGSILELDEKKVIPNPNLSIELGALNPFTMPSASEDRRELFAFCKKNKIDLSKPWNELPENQKKIIWNGSKGFMGVRGLFEYLEQIKYKMHVRVFISRYRSPIICPECQGGRLRKESQSVFVHGKNIQELTSMTVEELQDFFLNSKFSKFEMQIANEVLKQLNSRLDYLMRVGVHYLALNRETRTISGGEYQRITLANQLGMGLSQSLYVLDEPTVGLHPRDNERLLSILMDLKNLGNTLVVVEHDHDVIKSSENLIEMGPGSGYLGGSVVYSGPTQNFYSDTKSITAPYLKPKKWVPYRSARPVELDNYKYKIELKGAVGHNLKNLDVVFPLNRLVVVTGVSGSGKSTLVTKTLYPALARALDIEYTPTQPYGSIEGANNIKNVLLIDQSPVGRSARSSPITYLKAFDGIRTIMASTEDAKSRGYNAGTFSLNVDGGRCPSCKGTGFEEIDMQFMDNVIIPCDVCDGKKYRQEILEVKFQNKNITEILNLTVKEAMDFFVAHPHIRKPLSLLKEVGLDYLQIGQSASSLSGGESQRMKIARELTQVHQKNTLYILDEPTTGLHFREVDLLMKVLHKLIESGGSVIVIEHNLDVILNSDYVIDLGPEAGKQGGRLVASGTPEELMKCKESLTGKFLKKYVEYN